MSEIKITKTVSILETMTVITFCLGITSIIYFLINAVNAKMEWSHTNTFVWSGTVLLLTSILINKWADYELKKIYKKNA